MKFATRAIHDGQHPDPATGAIMTPVYLSATYVQSAPGVHKGFDYSRTNHPTRLALEKNIASLEEGKYGLCFASGLAAETAVLGLLKTGDHVISCQDLYGGSYRLFTKVFNRFNVEFSFVDTTEPDEIKGAVKSNSKMLWLESPSNPLLSLTDIQVAAEIAHTKGLLVVVDNTFASPCLQQPLKLGADIIIHSTTKYLGGHSDVVGGALVTNKEELFNELKFLQNAMGGIPGPLDCFLVLRGTKTLEIRIKKHCENAQKIAEFFRHHKDVERVYYPGLPNHPGHEIAKKQMSGFGGMVSVALKGDRDRNVKFASSTKIFQLAESLGGVESLIGYPYTMTHGTLPVSQKMKIGLPETLIRLSVGIEDIDDLIDDIDKAIQKSNI